jgi:hypothetical protein
MLLPTLVVSILIGCSAKLVMTVCGCQNHRYEVSIASYAVSLQVGFVDYEDPDIKAFRCDLSGLGLRRCAGLSASAIVQTHILGGRLSDPDVTCRSIISCRAPIAFRAHALNILNYFLR